MDNIKIVLEDIEENSYIISLLGRFATVERIEDKTVNGWDCVYSFPQFKITNIENIEVNTIIDTKIDENKIVFNLNIDKNDDYIQLEIQASSVELSIN